MQRDVPMRHATAHPGLPAQAPREVLASRVPEQRFGISHAFYAEPRRDLQYSVQRFHGLLCTTPPRPPWRLPIAAAASAAIAALWLPATVRPTRAVPKAAWAIGNASGAASKPARSELTAIRRAARAPVQTTADSQPNG